MLVSPSCHPLRKRLSGSEPCCVYGHVPTLMQHTSVRQFLQCVAGTRCKVEPAGIEPASEMFHIRQLRR